MIRRIQIDNFKSLDGFSLPPVGTPPLANFTCLIGANGSGKTSVLQAIDFLSQLVKGRVTDWLNDRKWSADELPSQLKGCNGEMLHFEVEFQATPDHSIIWSCDYMYETNLVTKERVVSDEIDLLSAGIGNGPAFFTLREDLTRQSMTGLSFSNSALSVLDDKQIHPDLRSLKAYFANGVSNFELVSTFNLKQDSIYSKQIGSRGENLPGFLFELKKSPGLFDRVYTRVQECFPSAPSLGLRHFPSEQSDQPVALSAFEVNTRQLAKGPKGIAQLAISSRHFSDGFIRILATVAQIEYMAEQGKTGHLLLLDEIENGVHPELLQGFVRYLATAPIQIIATTHSPMILNYLTDKQAEESVILLYRNSEGRSRSCRYFDLPSTKKKLGILGPGEVYVDTSIEQLAHEAEEMERSASAQAGTAAQ